MNQSTIHPDLCQPIRSLSCCCCGGSTQGRQFHNQDTGYGLGACCVEHVKPRVEDMARTYGIEGVHYKLDPEIKVREPAGNGEWSTWRISQNLTDRWGDINRYNEANKPLTLLEGTHGLLERLTAQMCDEITFVARKDGQFGLLFEIEFCSIESEKDKYDSEDSDEWSQALKPHAQVVSTLLAGLQALAPQYPGVSFAVPDESQIRDGRPAAWAFVPDGLLTEDQRHALSHALHSL